MLLKDDFSISVSHGKVDLELQKVDWRYSQLGIAESQLPFVGGFFLAGLLLYNSTKLSCWKSQPES
jgi:hypothetical protein